MVTFNDITAAAEVLAGVANQTPVVTSRTVDRLTGARVFFKCEQLQRVGAFKFRGAYNALSRLTDDEKSRGVLTWSSGNHAQAVALAAKLLGIHAVVVMPDDAPEVKVQATLAYGAEVVRYEKHRISREALGQQLAAERRLPIIPPYDHRDVIAGQGTAVKELIEEVGALDYILTPCGGGGLLSGSAVAANHLLPACRVIGVEPATADDATRSFKTGVLQTVHNPDTVADGARTPSLGTLTFPLICQYVFDMLTVTDAEILEAMFFLWERLKLVVEPTGALAFAAVMAGRLEVKGARVGIVLSGGNVDIDAIGGWRRR